MRKKLERAGSGVHVGEWGAYKFTLHKVVLAWMRDSLDLWKEAGWSWSMWNLRGSVGVLDSERADVQYENWRGTQTRPADARLDPKRQLTQRTKMRASVTLRIFLASAPNGPLDGMIRMRPGTSMIFEIRATQACCRSSFGKRCHDVRTRTANT
ncbi:MAG: glycoside hydrolase [Verrucomicrobiales bacterium]|nr:glycoside hydrolase [Verrucomicrobiales bacterium]